MSNFYFSNLFFSLNYLLMSVVLLDTGFVQDVQKKF